MGPPNEPPNWFKWKGGCVGLIRHWFLGVEDVVAEKLKRVAMKRFVPESDVTASCGPPVAPASGVASIALTRNSWMVSSGMARRT